MLAFLVRRCIYAVFVLVGVSTIVFGLMYLSGDPTITMVPEDATPQQIQQVRHEMGFDRPFIVQYGLFMSSAVRGDFGNSYRLKQPALRLVLDRMPATFGSRPFRSRFRS